MMFDNSPAFWTYFTIATDLSVIALKLWTNKDIQLRKRILLVSFSTTLACIFAISVHYAIQLISEVLAAQYIFLIIGVTVIITDSILMSILKNPGNATIKAIGNSIFSSSAYYFTAVTMACVLVIVFWIGTAILTFFVSWFR